MARGLLCHSPVYAYIKNEANAMSAEQTSVELTTRDVFQQVDRRLSLIEGDLRALDEKLDDKIDGLRSETSTQFGSLRSEMNAGFARADTKIDTLDAKFDTLHLGTTQDILSVRQEVLAVRQEIRELELRLKHDLTLRLGGMMVVGITVVATLVKLL